MILDLFCCFHGRNRSWSQIGCCGVINHHHASSIRERLWRQKKSVISLVICQCRRTFSVYSLSLSNNCWARQRWLIRFIRGSDKDLLLRKLIQGNLACALCFCRLRIFCWSMIVSIVRLENLTKFEIDCLNVLASRIG